MWSYITRDKGDQVQLQLTLLHPFNTINKMKPNVQVVCPHEGTWCHLRRRLVYVLRPVFGKINTVCLMHTHVRGISIYPISLLAWEIKSHPTCKSVLLAIASPIMPSLNWITASYSMYLTRERGVMTCSLSCNIATSELGKNHAETIQPNDSLHESGLLDLRNQEGLV